MARLSNAPTRSAQVRRFRPSAPTYRIFLLLPLMACAYAVIVSPLILATCGPMDDQCLMESRPENRIFWPAMAAVSIIFALHSGASLKNLALPPHIICFLAYLTFAGASVTWAFKPEISFIRFSQQAMIVTSIIVPALLMSRTADLMHGLFICFALASALNLVFVFGAGYQTIMDKVSIGYNGYFTGKGLLGQCAVITCFLAAYELLFPGYRRALGAIAITIAITLLLFSQSKTSLGLALLVPALAGAVLFIRRFAVRVSPALLLALIPIGYMILSSVSGFNVYRLSYILYGDSSFTGRTVIWEFADWEIARRPLLGWGYQSFWLVGPDGPAIVDAPGWVKTMPHAHNGYKDAMLELGYIGLALLLTFIFTTLHAVGRVADRSFAHAWLVLSIALFVIVSNFLETTWMRAFDFMWVVFLIVTVEIARYRHPSPSNSPKRPRRYQSARSAAPAVGTRYSH